MNSEIESFLAEWKGQQTDAKETRSVTILPVKSNPGENEIMLKMSVRVVDLTQSETVSVTRKIQLQEVASDINVIKDSIQILQTDFSRKCHAALDRLSRMHDKDSYNERNPY